MSPRFSTWFYVRGLPLGAALACQSIGALGIVGWLFGSSALTRLWPDQAPLPFDFAVSAVALGTAMYLAASSTARDPGRRTRHILAWLAVGLAVAALMTRLLGLEIGPKNLYVAITGRAEATPMWIATAMGLLAAGLCELTRGPDRHRRRASALAAIPVGVGVLMLGNMALGGIAPSMAATMAAAIGGSASTAITLIGLGVGQFGLAQDRGEDPPHWGPAGPRLPLKWVMGAVIAVPLLTGGAVIAAAIFRDLQFAVVSVVVFAIISAAALATIVWSIVEPLQSRLQLKQRALAAAHDGIVITRHTEEGDPILYANDAFLHTTGYTLEECWGKDCRFLNASLDDMDDERRAIKGALRSGTSITLVVRNVRKDGSTFFNRLSLSPIRNSAGLATHHIGIIEDISSEQAVSDRVRDLNLEVARTDDALKQSYLEKDALIEIVSHELRGPLNSALTWVGLARDEPTPSNIERTLQVVEQSIATQSRLIDDLVHVARSSPRQMALRFEELDLVSVVRNCVEEQRPALPATVSLELQAAESGPVLVQGDRERLWQVIRNLVGNAAKHGGDTTHIRISVATGPYEALMVVEDDGMGIAPGDIGNVLKPFWRAHDDVPGAGLGLTVVQSLVRRHGGRLTVESDGIGCGARFTVALPRLRAAQGASADGQ